MCHHTKPMAYPMTTDERTAGASEHDFFANAASSASSIAVPTLAPVNGGVRKASRPSRATPGRRKTTTARATKAAVVVVDEVVESSTLVELRKPPESITVRNMGTGEISLLQRKAFNFLLHHAQQSQAPERQTYEVSIQHFERMIGYETGSNREYLRGVARSLVAVQVEFDYSTRKTAKRGPSWGVSALIAEVFVEGNTIRYSLAPEMSKRLLKPEIYSRIDLYVQARFKTYASLVLWEIASRYFGWEQCETVHESWEWWSVNLSGANVPHEEFRDFNKMLERAIKSVNDCEDRFQIQAVVSRRGKKVDKLWFELSAVKQPRLALGEPATAVSPELTARLAALGLSTEDIAQQVIAHGEDYLHAQADYMDKRARRKNAAKLVNPRAFFLSCAEKNYADAPLAGAKPPKAAPQTKPKSPVNPSAQSTLDSIYEKLVAAEIAKLRDQFSSLSPEDQENSLVSVRDDLKSKNKPVWEIYKKSGLTRVVVQTVVALVHAKSSKRPSDADLYKYAIENGLLRAAA